MQLRFVSRNPHKFNEAKAMVHGSSITLIAAKFKIDEIQTANEHELARDKALKAFLQIGKPLIVEHTGLHLDVLSGLPGGLTQTFWDAIEADRFSSLFGGENVLAKTTI